LLIAPVTNRMRVSRVRDSVQASRRRLLSGVRGFHTTKPGGLGLGCRSAGRLSKRITGVCGRAPRGAWRQLSIRPAGDRMRCVVMPHRVSRLRTGTRTAIWTVVKSAADRTSGSQSVRSYAKQQPPFEGVKRRRIKLRADRHFGGEAILRLSRLRYSRSKQSCPAQGLRLSLRSRRKRSVLRHDPQLPARLQVANVPSGRSSVMTALVAPSCVAHHARRFSHRETIKMIFAHVE